MARRSGAEVSCGHFGKCLVDTSALTLKLKTKHSAYAKAYPSVSENNFKFNTSGLYRAALSHGGKFQSLAGCPVNARAPTDLIRDVKQ